MPVENIDQGINNALKRIGELVGADRSYVFLFKENGLLMDNTHEWCRKGIQPAMDQLKNLDPKDFYIVSRMMETRKEFYLNSLTDLPDDASTDRDEFEREGIRSIIIVPIFVGRTDLGFIGFDSVRKERTWSEDTIYLLKLVGGIIASAVVRKRSQEDLILERNRAELYLDLLGHDIGNLHQGIFTSIQLAKLKKDIPGSFDMAMDRAEEITKRSMMLVKSVLLLSKLRAQEPELVSLDIKEPIQHAMSTIENLFSHKSVDFSTNFPEGKFPIMAEPVVSELFFNLFHNGVKFQESEVARIEVSLERWENSLAVKICDHGPGIPDSMKRTIFQRFTKGGNGSQTGLGLSLVQALVDRYNGTIDIIDRVKGDFSLGACFIVTFPLVKTGQ
jgi:signal transduction histidine kinase